MVKGAESEELKAAFEEHRALTETKVEHSEIAAYGSLVTYAKMLGYKDAPKLLAETLAEKKDTDKALTAIATRLNMEAAEEEAEA